MEIGALSFVMHVCCGISTTNSRRSTVCATLWTGGGSSRTMPGPAVFSKLPSRKTISRWYSGTMWMIARNARIKMTMRIPTVTRVTSLGRSLSFGAPRRFDDKPHAVHTLYSHRAALRDVSPFAHHGPILAGHMGDATGRDVGLRHADRTDQ